VFPVRQVILRFALTITTASVYGGNFIKAKNFFLREVGTEDSYIINTKLCLKT